MRQLKKQIVKQLKTVCNDVYFQNAEVEKEKYICYHLNTSSVLDGYELLELQIDIWTIRKLQVILDDMTQKIKKLLNHLTITESEYSASIYFDRTIFESSNDEKLKRNTMIFEIRYREV